MSTATVGLAPALPPIVLEQQNAIGAALDLADSWDREAAGLHRIAQYTLLHGTSLVADRYAARGHTLARMAADLRGALQPTQEEWVGHGD